jgi:hypothetical protein
MGVVASSRNALYDLPMGSWNQFGVGTRIQRRCVFEHHFEHHFWSGDLYGLVRTRLQYYAIKWAFLVTQVHSREREA